MFASNKIFISKERVLKLFRIIDEGNTGELDLDKFKAFIKSPLANQSK